MTKVPAAWFAAYEIDIYFLILRIGELFELIHKSY